MHYALILLRLVCNGLKVVPSGVQLSKFRLELFNHEVILEVHALKHRLRFLLLSDKEEILFFQVFKNLHKLLRVLKLQWVIVVAVFHQRP